MRRMHLLTALAVACVAAFAAACGGSDNPDLGDLSKADVYRANVSAQCQDAQEERKALSFPEVGNGGELASYLQKVIAIEDRHRTAIEDLDPPAELQEDRRRALQLQTELSATVAGYMRAARGGRPFDTVVGQLQRELNPQIRRANTFFEQADIAGCRQELLDFDLG